MEPGEQQSHQMLAETSSWAITGSVSRRVSTSFACWQQGRLDAVLAPTRTVTERPEHRLTQGWLDDNVIEIVVMSFSKARIIGRGLNNSLRQRLELIFPISSSLDLCHSCFLHPISLPSSPFTCYFCWLLSDIFRPVLVSPAVLGS